MTGTGNTVDLGANNLYRYVNAKSVYDAGYTQGYAEGSTKTANANVTYTAKHTHGDYCYPIAEKTNVREWSAPRDDQSAYVVANYVTFNCSVCGKSFDGMVNDGDYRYPSDYHWQTANNAFNAHLTAGRCTAGGYKCGKSTGTYTTTNVTTLGEGDSVISAVINF